MLDQGNTSRQENGAHGPRPARTPQMIAGQLETALRAFRQRFNLDSLVEDPPQDTNFSSAILLASDLVRSLGFSDLGEVLGTHPDVLTRKLSRTERKAIAVGALTVAENDLISTGRYSRGYDWIVRASALEPTNALILYRAWQLYDTGFLDNVNDFKVVRRVLGQGVRMFDRFAQLAADVFPDRPNPKFMELTYETRSQVAWSLVVGAHFANELSDHLATDASSKDSAAKEAAKARFFCESVARLIGVEPRPSVLLANPPAHIDLPVDAGTAQWLPRAFIELAYTYRREGNAEEEQAASKIVEWFKNLAV